jgi:hypothetical protein
MNVSILAGNKASLDKGALAEPTIELFVEHHDPGPGEETG